MSQFHTNDKNLIFFNYRVKQTLDKLDNFVFAMTYPSKVQFKKIQIEHIYVIESIAFKSFGLSYIVYEQHLG